MMMAYEAGQKIWVATRDGWSTFRANEFTVERVTPKGQIVATDGYRTYRFDKNGRLYGDRYTGAHIVTAERAATYNAQLETKNTWVKIRTTTDKLDKAARDNSLDTAKAIYTEIGELLTKLSA